MHFTPIPTSGGPGNLPHNDHHFKESGKAWSFKASQSLPTSEEQTNQKIETNQIYPTIHPSDDAKEIKKFIDEDGKEIKRVITQIAISELDHSTSTYKTNTLKSDLYLSPPENEFIPQESVLEEQTIKESSLAEEALSDDEDNLFGEEIDAETEIENVDLKQQESSKQVVEGADVETQGIETENEVKQDISVVNQKVKEGVMQIIANTMQVDQIPDLSPIYEELGVVLEQLKENHTKEELTESVTTVLRKYQTIGLFQRNGVPLSNEEFEKFLKATLDQVSKFYDRDILPLILQQQKMVKPQPEEEDKNKILQGSHPFMSAKIPDEVYVPKNPIFSNNSDREAFLIAEMMIVNLIQAIIKHERAKAKEEALIEKDNEILAESIKKYEIDKDVRSFEIKVHDVKKGEIKRLLINQPFRTTITEGA
jgi:hypothetical protein